MYLRRIFTGVEVSGNWNWVVESDIITKQKISQFFPQQIKRPKLNEVSKIRNFISKLALHCEHKFLVIIAKTHEKGKTMTYIPLLNDT